MSIRKLRAGRVPNVTANNWVGETGTLFYDESTGQFKIADGYTPGGHYVSLVVATTTQVGGIKAGAGANVGSDGTLTIDTTGLPLSIGNLSIVYANISTVNANQDLNLLSNGTGNVNIVGNLHVHTTSGGLNSTPILEARNNGNVYVNGNLITNGGTYHNGNVVFVGATTHFGNITTQGNLITVGSSYFTGPLTETGNLTVAGNLIANGPAYYNGPQRTTGDSTFIGNIYITGVAINNGLSVFNGDITMTGNAAITGNTTVTGNTFVTGPTTVTGNTSITGNVTLSGNSYIYGNTFQTGRATYIITTDNSNLGALELTGSTNGNILSPLQTGVMLHITGQPAQSSRVYNDAQGSYALFVGRRYNGNVSVPSQVLANTDIMRIASTAYTDVGMPNIGPARISFVTNEDQTTTNQGARIEFWLNANSSGPAYSNIRRVASIDPALGFVGNLSGTASTAATAGTVINPEQTTITKLGTLGNLTVSGTVQAGNITVTGSISDANGNVRNLPVVNKSTGYTLQASDAGNLVSISSGNVTVPASVFVSPYGQAISIFNNNSVATNVIQSTNVTLRLAGTAATGNRTLARYGIASMVCVAANTFVISGAGLT